MLFNQVHIKYSNLLYEIASEAGKIDEVISDTTELAGLFETQGQLKRIIESPVIKDKDKKAVLMKILDGKLDAQTLRFIEFLETKDRLTDLYGIIKKFDDVLDQRKGVVKVKLSTRESLNSEQLSEIRTVLERQFKKQVHLNLVIDTNLLGGFIAESKDLVVDASVNNQLKILRKKFLQSGINAN